MIAAWLLVLAIDGQVVNRSTGKPAGDVGITLIKAGQGGMQPVGTVRSGADGRFKFDVPDFGTEAMGLLQASYGGATYTKMVPPGGPKEGLELTVFDSTANAAVAKVEQHMMVLEHTPGELRVSETIMLRNESTSTYANPQGTVKFYAPPMANGKLQVRASSGAQGMPLNRPAKPTGEANVYAVDFPVKPGETRFDISWVAPFATPADISGRVLHKEAPLMLVAPRGMTLKGEKLISKGTEPRTQASIYEVASGAFTALVEGAGSIRNQAQESEQEDGGTPVDIIPPRIYDAMYPILGLAFAILGLAFYKLLRSPSA